MSDKEPQQWMRDAAKEICRETYDWFAMGGLEPNSGVHGDVAEIIAAHCPEKELGHGTEQPPADIEAAIERAVRRLAGNLTICSQFYSEAWRTAKIREVLESELVAPLKSGKYPIARPSSDAKIQAFWDAQAEWSRATFGSDKERDHIGPLKHLAKEAVEAQVRPADRTEIADCQFLVFDAARRSGMTLAELFDVCDQKLLVNKARKWSRPTSDNPVEHVREVGALPDKCSHERYCRRCGADMRSGIDLSGHSSVATQKESK